MSRPVAWPPPMRLISMRSSPSPRSMRAVVRRPLRTLQLTVSPLPPMFGRQPRPAVGFEPASRIAKPKSSRSMWTRLTSPRAAVTWRRPAANVTVAAGAAAGAARAAPRTAISPARRTARSSLRSDLRQVEPAEPEGRVATRVTEVLDGGIEPVANRGRGAAGVGVVEQGGGAGDVRRGHRRPRHRAVAVARERGDDVDAGRGELDVVVVVGERRRGVGLVDRRDRDDLVAAGRVLDRRVAVVAGGGDQDRAAAPAALVGVADGV